MISTTSAGTPSTEDTLIQSQFNDLGYRSGTPNPGFSLYHLGRDNTRFQGPGLTIVLPIPLIFKATAEDEDVHVELYLREPLTHDQYWAAASAGPWDLRRPRHRGWALEAPDPNGWVRGTVIVAAVAIPPAVSVWLGHDDDLQASAKIAVLPRGAAAQRANILQQVVGALPLSGSLQPAPDAKGNRSQAFELGVSNVFGALGYSCINVGIPVKSEGLDILAFKDDRQECVLISVTTSGAVSRKLSTLLPQRSVLIPNLPAWTCKLVIATAVPRHDIGPGDLQDCADVGVAVVTSSELQHVVGDSELLRQQIEELLAGVPPATG